MPPRASRLAPGPGAYAHRDPWLPDETCGDVSRQATFQSSTSNSPFEYKSTWGAPLNDTVSDLARGGRSWATLDQITSLDGESDEATLKQMKNDASFLSFCKENNVEIQEEVEGDVCLLYTSPSPRDATLSRMPSSA